MEMMHTPALLPARAARLVVTPHPLTLQGQTSAVVVMEDDQSLASVLHSAGVDEGWVVELDGLEVPAIMWQRTRVKHGVVIECRRAVHDKKTLRAVAFVTLAYYTMGAGNGWLVGAGSLTGVTGLTASLIGAAAFMAGSMVINRTLPPPMSAQMDMASNNVQPTYSLSGGRNSARLWEPMSLVLGEPYVVPDLAGQPWSYFSGEDQYLVQNFHAGINVQAVRELRIGQTALSRYEGVSLRSIGIPDSEWLGDMPSNSVDTIAGALLDRPDGTDGEWIVRTTSPNTIGIGIDLEMTLFAVNKADGSYYDRSVTLSLQYCVHGTSEWKGVPTFAYYIEKYVTGSNTKTDSEGNTVTEVDYAWRNVFYPDGKAVYSHKSPKPLRVSINLPVPKGQYDVALFKNSRNETDSSAQNTVTWTQLKSFQPDLGRYPGQALVSLTVKASGQLNGSLDQFNWIATSKPMPFWNGSAWVTATNKSNGLSNPGAQILKLARGIYDDGGKLIAGLGWPDSRIDIESLKSFMVWCSTMGFTFNAVIQQSMSVGDLLSAIAYAGMGTINWAGGKLGVQWLSDDAPIEGVINMGNIKAKSFSVAYATSDRADEIEYGYFDESINHQWNSLRVKSPAVDVPVNTARLSNIGITNERHASILARRAMAENIYMGKFITFEQDLEYLTYRRGAVLALSHDMTQWGYSGRVQAVSNTGGMVTLTLDDTIPAPSSGRGYIGLRLLGETQYRIFAVKSFAGSTRSVTLGNIWPSGVALPGESGNAMDALWIYDFKATPGLKVVVTKIEPSDNQGGAKVTVAPLPDEFWNYVLSGAYTPPPNRSLIEMLPTASDVKVSEQLKRQGNTYYVELTAVFAVSGNFVEAEIWGSADGTQIYKMGTSSNKSFTWRGGLDETWNIEIRPKNLSGHLGYAARVSYSVTGLTNPPSDVLDLAYEVSSGGITVSWTPCPDADYGETVLKVGTDWGSASVVAKTHASSHLLSFLPTGSTTIWAVHVDTTGNFSSMPASLQVVVTKPSAPSGLTLNFGTSSIEAKWDTPDTAANQQPIDHIELSWGSAFTSIIDAKKADTATFGWMAAGTYTLYARCVDAAGNTGEVAQSVFQVLAPSQPLMTAVETQINAVTLRWQDAKSSQPIRKYAIYYGEAGTPFSAAMLYGSAGSDSRSDVLFFRSSGPKVAYLVAEDVAGNVSAPRQIDLTVTMPNDFLLATEYYEDWQPSELVNGVILGGASGQIILPANVDRTWQQRLSNNGWSTAKQKVDTGFPYVIQPVPLSGKHVERKDVGKLIPAAVVRVVPSIKSSVEGYTATVRIRGSDGDSSTAWQSWLVGEAVSLSNFRWLEVEYAVQSDGKGFVVIDDLAVRVEITEVSESATLLLSAADASGSAYTCTKTFLDVQAVQATPLNSPSIAKVNCVIDDSAMPARIYVQAWDTSNNRTGGTVSLYISGV